MIEYYKKNQNGGLISLGNKGEQPFLIIMNSDEFRDKKELFVHHKEFLHSLGSIRYCKAEVFGDCIQGTLRIPQKSEQRQPLISFGFYMTEQALYLVEDVGDLKRWLEKQIDRFQSAQSSNQLFLQLLEQLIENDILYLSHLEKEMENMEDDLSHGIPKDFYIALTKHRQKLSELNAYYEQLTAIGDLIQSHDGLLMAKNAEQWDRYTLRTERLQNHVQLLRENVLQLRELYQSQQNAQQNNVMCILTVVTTLFLPLTLLTGWYGMNFAYMPELNWKYGYLAVIIVALLIVCIEIVYFKKKKLF